MTMKATTLRIAACLSALLIATVSTAHAQVEVWIETFVSPTEAKGIIFSGNDVRFVPATANKVRDGILSVTFDTSGGAAPTLVSAWVGVSGKIMATAPLRPLDQADNLQRRGSLAVCPESPNIGKYEQIALLQRLVDVRSARRELGQIKLERALQGELLDHLRRLEAGFGFVYAKPLSAGLPTTELLARLSRIRLAINSFDYHNQR